jgi:hypothetical protein
MGGDFANTRNRKQQGFAFFQGGVLIDEGADLLFNLFDFSLEHGDHALERPLHIFISAIGQAIGLLGLGLEQPLAVSHQGA